MDFYSIHTSVPTSVKDAGVSEADLATAEVTEYFVTGINYSRMGSFAIESIKSQMKNLIHSFFLGIFSSFSGFYFQSIPS